MTKPDTLAILRARHPDYTGPLGEKWWKLCRDAYQGGGGFRTALVQAGDQSTWGDEDLEVSRSPVTESGSYLVRYPREQIRAYRRRQAMSTYPNYILPIVREYAGILWRRPPQRDTKSTSVETFWKRPAGRSKDMDAWMAVGSQRAQLHGWAVAFVDGPVPAKGEAPAKPTEGRWLQPEELVDWELDGDGCFEWARLCTVIQTRDPFTGETVRTEHYTTWTRDSYQRADVVGAADKADAKVTVYPAQSHPLGRVPLAVLYWTPPVESAKLYGTSQVDGAVAAAYELFNVLSEQREHERGQVFAILCVQSQRDDVLTNLKLGVNNGIRVEPDAAFPAFIAPPDSVGLYLSQRADGLVNRIYESVSAERASAEPTTQSGVSKAWDFEAQRAVLIDATKRLTEVELEIAEIVALWAGENAEEVVDNTSVRYPTDFDVDDLDTALSTQLAALDKAALIGAPQVAKHARTVIGRALNPAATPDEEKALETQVQALFDADVRRFEQSVTPKIETVKVDPSTLTSFTLPFLSINEVRASLGAAPVPGGDSIAALAMLQPGGSTDAAAGEIKPLTGLKSGSPEIVAEKAEKAEQARQAAQADPTEGASSDKTDAAEPAT